jgi:D-sedoheptulose 7-phosphate isomerase
MSDEWKQRVAESLAGAIDLHRTFASGDLTPVIQAARLIVRALADGRKLLICGNGGSASDAQHLAAELVGRFQRPRRPLPALALTVDSSVLTAIANDFSYDEVFARQIEGLGHQDDVLLAISTSGRSSNVLRAVEQARRIGMTSIALTANDGGLLGPMADVHVNVPSADTARAQEVHRTILHVICELIETELSGV